MLGDISLGCNGRGAQGVPRQPLALDEQFRLVKEAGVFDHFDRMPQPGQEAEYVRASRKHGLPIRTGLWSYTAGKDEASGRAVTDGEVVAFYLAGGRRTACQP